MKILFVCNSIPFPARQGVELPLKHFIASLSVNHIVDIVVLSTGKHEQNDYLARRDNVPSSVRHLDILTVTKRSKIKMIFRELVGIAPIFFRDGYHDEALKSLFSKRDYDIIWVSPFGAIGLVLACRQLGLMLKSKLVIGQNDVLTYADWTYFKEAITARNSIEFQRVIRGMRIPLMWLYERRYVCLADLVHLQTSFEKQKMYRLLGRKDITSIVDAPNGKKTELDTGCHQDRNSKKVLFMTKLAGGRQKESGWFLSQVWPRVLEAVPDAQLLLVGTPPNNEEELQKTLPPNVQICGYVDDLAEVFNSVALSVVPTQHGSGWINRISDSLTAGVPIVACRPPLQTIPGLEIGTHALKGESASEFADNVIALLSDKDLRTKISKNAYDLGQKLPTWEQTIIKVEAALLELISD